MRHTLFLSLAALTAAGLISAGCGGQGSSSPAVPPVNAPATAGTPTQAAAPFVPPTEFAAANLPQLADGHGMAEGALGVYFLHRDPADPTQVELRMPRIASKVTQGDLFELSARPYMSPADLVILGATPGPNNTTDYTVRFTHPFDMPTNLDPPQSASKRVDLFIFDVNLVAAADGTQAFFGGTVVTNIDAMPKADGYRKIGPLFATGPLGVTTANTFPYVMLDNVDPLNPAGNYNPEEGWIGSEYLAPTGYDVVPQGAEVTTTVRLSNDLPDPLPLVVVAKYMDPRDGNTGYEKRQNRLPSADPTGLRYFLPEAAGDVQTSTLSTSGTLLDSSDTEIVTITATVRDWDHSAQTSTTFPDHKNITHIAERSRVQDAVVSVPDLRAVGEYPALVYSNSYGALNELVDIEFHVNNRDLTFEAPPEGATIPALVRYRDSQDFTAPTQTFLDENLNPQPLPVGFEPSTRYQITTIFVEDGLRIPDIISVEPARGPQGEDVQFSATVVGQYDELEWFFGLNFTPSGVVEDSPVVTLGTAGANRCAVVARNAAGEDTFYFDFIIDPPPPNITAVFPDMLVEGEIGQFFATNDGGPVDTWEWTFGPGAIPDTSSEESPSVIGGAPGDHSGSVRAINISGESTFDFDFFVIPARPPEVDTVLPDSIYARRPVTFSAIYLPTGGIATTWEWDFGGGCTPNISTAEAPMVTSNMPGIYDGTLTVGNQFGDTTFNFQYEVKVRLAGMNVYVMTNGDTYPTLWWNMASWSEADVFDWFDTYVNVLLEPAGIALDANRFSLIPMDRPDLFNLDTASENNAIFNMLYYDGDWDRLNFYIINKNNYSGWAGVMDDRNCNYTNEGRGCISITYTTQYSQKVAGHELGHVFNLPHTRTRRPITALNNNLMGYYTNDVSLEEDIFVENPGGCQIWPGNPMSQYQVMNDWFNEYSLLPE